MRSALVTNSSISLPAWRVMPRMIEPAISSASRRGELERVEEALDQPDAAVIEGGIEAVDRLGEHRVAEAIDDMRELGDDRRVERDVIAVRNQEHVDVRLDLAGKLFEHEMLILHLGAELGGLEQALAVPIERARGRAGVDRQAQSRRQRRAIH